MVRCKRKVRAQLQVEEMSIREDSSKKQERLKMNAEEEAIENCATHTQSKTIFR